MSRYFYKRLIPIIFTLLLIVCKTSEAQKRISATGVASEIQLTPYKTTMLADGKDESRISVKIIDRDGKEVLVIQKNISVFILKETLRSYLLRGEANKLPIVEIPCGLHW